MFDVNDMMSMLDWNNDLEIQSEGRKLASQIKCLSLFMQPMDKSYGKNVWENCALILSERTDEELQPYIFDLLDWLEDLNWPGAIVVYERLKIIKCREFLHMMIKSKIVIAKATENDVWEKTLSSMLLDD